MNLLSYVMFILMHLDWIIYILGQGFVVYTVHTDDTYVATQPFSLKQIFKCPKLHSNMHS